MPSGITGNNAEHTWNDERTHWNTSNRTLVTLPWNTIALSIKRGLQFSKNVICPRIPAEHLNTNTIFQRRHKKLY